MLCVPVSAPQWERPHPASMHGNRVQEKFVESIGRVGLYGDRNAFYECLAKSCIMRRVASPGQIREAQLRRRSRPHTDRRPFLPCHTALARPNLNLTASTSSRPGHKSAMTSTHNPADTTANSPGRGLCDLVWRATGHQISHPSNVVRNAPLNLSPPSKRGKTARSSCFSLSSSVSPLSRSISRRNLPA